MFIDKITLSLSAGKGGDGIIAWRREKFIPKGGPAGGDGGNGGSIYIQTDENTYSLEDYRHKKFLNATNGQPGGASNKKGKNGKDLIVKVPPGTLVKDSISKEIIYDLTEPGQKIMICKGGMGGRGNSQFKTSTNQAPLIFTKGTEGQSIEIELELKLIADIGLIGFPNAGKSTLLSKIAKIDVKIAPYPFTTLIPNLGIVEFDDFSRLFIADIPGLIKGAHLNKGLGFSFLKHIERTQVLVYVIDISAIDGRDPINDLITLQDELKSYNLTTSEKPFIVALNKIDTPEAKENINKFKNYFKDQHFKIFEISALTEEGFSSFLKALKELGQINGKRFK